MRSCEVSHATCSAGTGAPSRHRAQGCWVRQVDAGDTDDRLPGGFLVGAIVKVWVAHRLNWAGDLLGRGGEELPRDVSSELRCLEVATSRGFWGQAGDI